MYKERLSTYEVCDYCEQELCDNCPYLANHPPDRCNDGYNVCCPRREVDISIKRIENTLLKFNQLIREARGEIKYANVSIKCFEQEILDYTNLLNQKLKEREELTKE